MNFQDILKIKPANLKVLFCNKLIDDLTVPANYVAKYSSFRQLKTLLWDTRQIVKHGRVNILPNGEREYTADIESDEPVIYFWISQQRIFYVGKASNGWSNMSRQHQNGWNGKPEEERISKNRLLLENIFPEHPTGFNLHHGFAVLTIPVNQLTINYPEQLEALSPFKNIIPPVSVNIIDELEKIFIFICQPQINTTHKNGDGVNFEILKNILGVAGD